MNNRRKLIVALGASALAAPLASFAQQQAGKVSRVGVLTSNSLTATLQEAFRQGLQEHGYVEGQNILIEWREAGGQTERAKALAEELVASKVDVIVAIFTPAVRAAKNATSTIAVVMAPAGAPVGTGFVASLARPGGNITGIAGLDAELQGKRIELLRELIPGLTRVGLLINAADPFAKPFVDEAQVTTERTGIQIHIVDVRRPQDINAAFATMTKQRAGAVIVQGVLTASAWQAADLALRHRLPSVSVTNEFAESGGLMSYAASYTDTYRRAASYVDRILKGAKPGELAVEQPTRFELVINQKTAKTLGIRIPQSILVQATKVIE